MTDVSCALGEEITRQDQVKITRQEKVSHMSFLDAVALLAKLQSLNIGRRKIANVFNNITSAQKNSQVCKVVMLQSCKVTWFG